MNFKKKILCGEIACGLQNQYSKVQNFKCAKLYTEV